MNTYTFRIDDITVPFTSAVDLSFDYDYLTAAMTQRTMDGTGVRQGTYSKLKVTITGTGYFPLGLSDLDTFISHTLYCGAPRAITRPVPTFALSTDRRIEQGYEPFAMAIMPDGTIRDTSVTMSGNVASCVVIPGASAYRVMYYPVLQVFIEPPKESTDLRGANFGWSLICEEI